jgi:uncharacterized protein
MKAFFDSSAFAKRYIDEEGSGTVETLCAEADALGLCVLCVPEIVSALSRRAREGVLSGGHYREAKARLWAEVADATIVNLIPAVIAGAVIVLETNPVRASDALHVACAVQWHADLFVSADERQLSAAKKAQLRTRKV